MDKNLVNSHDRFFKELFSKKEEVIEFIAKTFPKEIVEKIDLQSLELDKTEYVDSKLRTNYSDIVYNSKYGKNTNIKISLLFEHKSYPETFPHLQLLGYMLKIWETQIKQKQSITPIIPIIFYHGKQKWVKQTFDTYFDDIDETLQNFIPKFEYQLVDTFEYSDDEIIKLFSNLQLQMGLLILKNIYNEQKIIQEVDKIFGEINQLLQTEQGEQFFEAIVSYLYYATNLETPKMVEKMRTISPNAGEKFVSTAMRLKMEGMENGIKKVAYSLLKQGVSDEIILIATKLTQKELDYLKSLKEYQLDLETV